MRNWLSFPTVGMKGEPAAACQTSWSDESMCRDWIFEIWLRIGAEWQLWKADGKNDASW